MANEYDVIVIGGGPAGYPAAIRAAQNKLKVAIIDEWKNKDGTAVFGGTCTNAGCIPSKALLESSELYHRAAHEFKAHGIGTGALSVDVATMQAFVPRANRSSAAMRSSLDTEPWWTNTSIVSSRMCSATASVSERDWQKNRLFFPFPSRTASRAKSLTSSRR